MNQKLKKITLIYVILAVVFTNGYFGFTDNDNTNLTQKHPLASPARQEFTVSVKNVQEYAAKNMVVTRGRSGNVLNFTNCNLNFTNEQSKNYFQDQVIFDFNQPSDCFNLSLGQTQSVTQSLEVKNLHQQKVQVVVIELPLTKISVNIRNSNLPDTKVSMVFSNYILAFQGKQTIVSLKIITAEQKPVLKSHFVQKTIEELQNFRC